MPKKAAGLSARKVDTIRTPGMFADGSGLYLQVLTSGAKTWIFRYQIAGRRREMGMGSASVYSLAEAREKAAEAIKLVKAGIDPLETKRKQAAESAAAAAVANPTTFRECAAAFIDANRPGWRNAKHADQWSATLETYVFPVMGDIPVAGIDTGLVLRVPGPIWTTTTETARRVRGRIEAILDYSKVCGFRDGENPARWKGHLDHVLPSKAKVAKVEHHASLPHVDMPAFWPRLQVQDGLGARALEFCILTATRTGETLGARWSEISLDSRTWIIPAVRMKAKAEHRVPLSDPAVALLRKLATLRRSDDDDLVFPGQRAGKSLSNMAMAMALRRMKLEVTPHGFRSTFRTWADECTAAQHEVKELCLAHTQGDKVVAAYARGDLFEKRRELMAAWADYCEGKTRI